MLKGKNIWQPRILYSAEISFRMKINKNIREKQRECITRRPRTNAKGSSLSIRQMIQDRISNLQKEIKSTGNGNSVGKRKIIFS